MSKRRQFWIISFLAIGLFVLLKSLPDTHCALLHADHQPVYDQGLEFCGVNEEANFYNPKDLQFPVKLDIKLNQEGGVLCLIKDDGGVFYDYEVKISHTQKIHLHLKQLSGRNDYIHLHPMADDKGVWHFKFPESFLQGNPGGKIQAYVDFIPLKSGRTILAESSIGWKNDATLTERISRNKVVSYITTSNKAGDSAVLRVKLGSNTPQGNLVLKPIMGTLGHAVIFSADDKKVGYAHMHPSLEGAEYDAQPTLAFKIKLPEAGNYELWININDGSNDYLMVPLMVAP